MENVLDSIEDTEIAEEITVPQKELKEDSPADVPQEVVAEILNDELARLTAQNEEYLAALQRLQADFDNFRKRNQTIRAAAFDDGTRAAAEALLPVLDNLYRAADTQTADTKYQNGVKMVLGSFISALASLSVTEIPTDGTIFDPSVHEAILQQDAEDAESGMVLQTTQKGYIFKERVIRAPKVVVAK